MDHQTLYQFASDSMKVIVSALLQLSIETHNFTSPTDAHWSNDEASRLLLCGKGVPILELPELHRRENLWLARSAIPFDLERAATSILYTAIEPFKDQLLDEAFRETVNFTHVSAAWIYDNPHVLPILMHMAGTFSKQGLKNIIGNVSDTSISRPASVKLAEILNQVTKSDVPTRMQISERLRPTIEGIVRDLVGRLLLEDFVAAALQRAKVPFKREGEYTSLSGVVYDFRADFIVPNEIAPQAFIEVRKSSTRHASLYAKDKMFSAINWKGAHKECLGILIVDGPWTAVSLEVMAKVFDYVVPISQAEEIASKVRQYLDGDNLILQWLIVFKIEPNSMKGN